MSQHAPQDPAERPALVWTLNPVQWDFVHCASRFSFYVGGLGAGKTTAGAMRAILRAVEYPGSLGVIGAPTYPMLRDATARTFFALLPTALVASYNKTEGHLILRNGSEILFRSLDAPDRLRGLNLTWFWLDEAPLCGYYAWQVLKGRLRQRGYATAGWATGTPKGRDGFARDFELAPRPGHRLFRASTWANAHNLPPDYISELGYSGAFAKQEIEGLFVAFEGLVYTLDASVGGHLAEPPERERWRRVIGGVDWGYTNPAVALVFALDGDGGVWQVDEFYQRRAGLEETLLPALLDLTRRYGVETWFCGPDEPEHIDVLATALVREGLSCRAQRADNSVRAGIQTVTSLLARRPGGAYGLHIAPRCVHTIAEYGSYQYATRASEGRDPSEQPLKQNDHCFGAGTMVLTEFGEQPIETVAVGTRVLTRDGWRPVVASGMTNRNAVVMRVTFSNGRELVGTPNHPIYVDHVGYIPLRALRYGDTMVVAHQLVKELPLCGGRESRIQARLLNTRASRFVDIRALVGGRTGCTTLHRASTGCVASEGSIRKSGRMQTGRYLRGIIFTIRTAIRSTMRLRILSAWQVQSTTNTICRFSVRRSGRSAASGFIGLGRRRRTGTALMQADSGMLSWGVFRGKVEDIPSTFASSADSNSSRGLRVIERSSARIRVSRRIEGHKARIWSNGSASYVADLSHQIGSEVLLPAPVRVVSLSDTDESGNLLSSQAVYNLTVAGTPEYYANGVLVHNCMDATRYALHTALGRARATNVYLDAMRRRVTANGERVD